MCWLRLLSLKLEMREGLVALVVSNEAPSSNRLMVEHITT